MDRGRCGYDLVGNKFLREKTLFHVREVHLGRLEKIKHREPGSSSTLDNTPPESLTNARFSNDPRKRRKKTERNNTIARQNKVLLQRISHILTAPPKNTDFDYQKMKKLMSALDPLESFAQELEAKRNKQFFDRVKKTTAYYHHEKWEEDYQRQLHGQKFMRKVTYTRPDNWIDPLLTNSSTASSTSHTEQNSLPPPSQRKQRTIKQKLELKSTENSPPSPSHSSSLASDGGGGDGDVAPLASSCSSIAGSPNTHRSNGSTTSHGSRLSTKSVNYRSKRSTKIKELRSSHLEQHNKYHNESGNASAHHQLRYSKRSASSQSLKSNGESVMSDGQKSESRGGYTTSRGGPSSKPPSRLLATCQRAIAIQQPEPLPYNGQRPRTTSEISGDSEKSFQSSSLHPNHNATLPPIRSVYSSSFYHKDHEPPLPPVNSKKLPTSLDVTIMCSIISYPQASPSQSTASSPPSIVFPSGTTDTVFPLSSSHLYVTVDGIYDTSIHCDAQISLYELLHFVVDETSPPPSSEEKTVSEPVMRGEEGKEGLSSSSCKDDDESTADLTVMSSSINSLSSFNQLNPSSGPGVGPGVGPSSSSSSSSRPHITHVELEDISREIVHQITLCYDDILGEYSIVLPDDGGLSHRSEEKPFEDVMGMTGEEALQIIKEFHSISFSRGLKVPFESSTPSHKGPGGAATGSSSSPISPPNQHITRQRSTGWNEIQKQQQQQQQIFQPEKVLLLCKIKRVSEEKAIVKCHSIRDSINKFIQKGRKTLPALAMDTTLELTITLPSVLNVDPELIQEYFENIARSLKIQHNGITGANCIVLQ